MDTVKARKLRVPFNAVKPAKVTVWLIPSTATLEGVPVAALVDIEDFIKQVLPGDAWRFDVPVDSLVDHREWAEAFGVTSKGPLVSYSDFSRFGWGVRPYTEGVASRGVEEGVGSNKGSYWTVFFAQNVVRGLCIRLIGCEMEVMQGDASGEEVYFRPRVQRLQREVAAYDNIPPLRGTAQWVQGQVKALWRRVDEGLTQDVNRRSLNFELRRGEVMNLDREARDVERAEEVTDGD
jgi:hypothetical protein